MKKTLSCIFALLAIAFVITSCEKNEAGQAMKPAPTDEKMAAPKPEEEGAAGFDEFPIGDEQDAGILTVAGVYFQPVDMEPAGNSIGAK